MGFKPSSGATAKDNIFILNLNIFILVFNFAPRKP